MSPKPVPSERAIIGNGDRDEVIHSRLVHEDKPRHKSLSIWHLQRRLTELGYAEAGADRSGFYLDLTREAVSAYQRDREEPEGTLTRDQLEAIFNGDDNVTLTFDLPDFT